MKFLNISDLKLKVVISSDECHSLGIDTSGAELARSEIRVVIRDILARAEQECGFAVLNEKILVQFYPLPSGECELFVTKLVGISKRDSAMLRGRDGIAMMEEGRGVYRFNTRDSLISAARAVYRPGITSSLYRADDGDYYLLVHEALTDGISEFEILIEYGERLPTLPLHIISEYGALVLADTALDSIIADNF